MKRLVLLGGGHAHLFVLEALAALPGEALDVTLVTPHPALIYTGMLPGYVAGHYSLERCSIDLVRLAGRARAAFMATTAVLVNPEMREVVCADGTVLPYDVLSFDIGSRTAVNARGAEENALLVRPLQTFVPGWNRVHERARKDGLRSISIVGGGAGGVELAFAIAHRLGGELGAQAPHVRILTNTPAPLPEFSDAVRERLRRSVSALGIGSHVGAAVVEVGAGYLRLDNGLEFESGATIWAGGAAAPEIFRDSGFATDERGFLSVDEHMQSTSHPGVFGAGDCATHEPDPRPKAGVFAVRAGPVLTHNLRSALGGGALARFRTGRRYLALISTGRKHAVGSWGPFGWDGRWVWRWKDRIDRRFVDRFTAS